MLHWLPPRPLALARLSLIVVPVLLLSGCVHQTTSDSTTTFRYDLWVPLTVGLGGLVAAPLGWMLRQRSARLGWSLLIAGPVAAFGFAPSLFADRIVLDSDHFELHTGVWGMSTVQTVPFANLQSLKLTSEVSTGRRGRKKTNYYFVCQMKSGEPIKVPMSSPVQDAAAMPIILQVIARQIPVSDETGEPNK